MSTSEGFRREDEMVHYLNDKKVKELNSNLKKMLEALFGVIDEEEIVKCEIVLGFAKPDLKITYQGIDKYVSMKTGNASTIHTDDIKKFTDYLLGLGFPKEAIDVILLFHYGDGTTDGSGLVRHDFNYLMRKYEDQIAFANLELNSNKDLIIKAVCYTMFGALNDEKPPADAIYYGTYINGSLATKYQIIRHIHNRSWEHIYCLHIGPLLMRPHARYVDRPIPEKNKREIVDVYWFNFVNDIKFISTKYSNYICKPRRPNY